MPHNKRNTCPKWILCILSSMVLMGCATQPVNTITTTPVYIEIDPSLLETEEAQYTMPQREEYEKMTLSQRFIVNGQYINALNNALYLANKKLSEISKLQNKIKEQIDKHIKEHQNTTGTEDTLTGTSK